MERINFVCLSVFVYLFIIVHLCCTFVIFSVYTMELSLQQAVEILGKTRPQVLYMIEQGRRKRQAAAATSALIRLTRWRQTKIHRHIL